MTRRLWSLSALPALLAAGPAAPQQLAVDIIPYAGLYAPIADVLEIRAGVDGIIAELSVGQAAGLLGGGRLDLWLTDSFGLEGGFAYALSDAEIQAEALGVSISEGADAHVWLGSARAIYRFMPAIASSLIFFINGGVAIIGRGGDAYEEFAVDGIADVEGKTDIGGVIGAGIIIDVFDAVGIRFDVEDYLYSVKLEVADEDFDSQFQNDIAVTSGMVIHLGR